MADTADMPDIDTTIHPGLVTATPVEVTDERAAKLRRLNLLAAALHAVSGTLMIVLGDRAFELGVTVFNLNGPPGTAVSEGSLDQLFGVPLALATAAFMWLSAIFHLLVATVKQDAYLAELRAGRNRYRWVEYSMSATLMMVLIALVSNVTDVAALIGIAFANVSMILFGWLMEMTNDSTSDPKQRWWTPFWFGCIAGVGPWLAIIIAIGGGQSIDGAESPPGFVYGILVTIFLLFNCFAIVQWLQYRGRGKWADYVRGEVAYIVLSFVAKSALAWQIFANTLIPT